MSNDSRVVIVTGGSRGLGLAIAKDLLRHGYRVAACSRNPTSDEEELLARYGPDGVFFWQACELGKEAEEQALFDAVLAWAGMSGLYALVNNAGIVREGVLATFPNVDSERILQVNLLSAMRLTRLALRVLLQQSRSGRVINISSIVGLRGYTGLAAYAASKAGMDGMTRSLAREIGRRGITVNSVAPGYLETELSANLNEDQRRQIINRTPLGRLGKTSDVVPVVRFLLSDEAGYITGQTLVVDGGISC